MAEPPESSEELILAVRSELQLALIHCAKAFKRVSNAEKAGKLEPRALLRESVLADCQRAAHGDADSLAKLTAFPVIEPGEEPPEYKARFRIWVSSQITVDMHEFVRSGTFERSLLLDQLGACVKILSETLQSLNREV